MVGRSPLAELEDLIPPPPKHTPESVARNYFAAELEGHQAKNVAKSADTVVILHDSVYGHRYSRRWTKKAEMADITTIVERPERINACILGLSMAYVCLGERHADGQYPPHPSKDPLEIPDIPFRIQKTARRLPLSSQAVTNVHGAQWMQELKIMCDNAESRLAGNGKELTRPDVHRGTGEKPTPFHEGDLYLCSESLEAMEGSLGAVCEGVDAVFEGSASGKGPFRAFVVIRPPGHHCSANYPSGFCWVNNGHVGIQHAALEHGLTHAAIIDFDLHHGDGSQAIAWEMNKKAMKSRKKVSIGYFSLHDIKSYPCEKGDQEKVTNASVCIENAHNQNIWNVHLQPWKSEAEFWELYETKYLVLLEKTRNYLRAETDRVRKSPNGPKAKGAIFLSAGFDASEWESSGMQRHVVNVPTEFYARLTRDVVRLAAEEGCGVDGRVISVLEGGYSDRALSTGVLSHLSGMTAGEPVVIKKEPSPNGLGYEMVQKIGTYDGHRKRESVTLGNLSYDPAWWSVQRLEQLDLVVNPLPLVEVKKPRDGPAPTYSSPTQSFIAKVIVPARRTSSGMSRINGSPRATSRPPSPPPPEVDWTIAAHELSKLLIPTDRRTTSYQPDELAAEVTRTRRERQTVTVDELSNSLDQVNLNNPRTLRTRTTTKPLTETEEEHDSGKPPQKRSDRRKTDIGVAVLAAEKATARSHTPIPVPVPSYTRGSSNRRASIASTTGSALSEAQGPVARGRRVTSGINSAQSRPATAQSIRPESSASVRNAPNASISVNKSRPSAPSRTEPSKVSRRKKSPLNDTGLNLEEPVKAPLISNTAVASRKLAIKPSSMDKLVEDLAQADLGPPEELKTEKPKSRTKHVSKATGIKPANIEGLTETMGGVSLGKPKVRPAGKAPIAKTTDIDSLAKEIKAMEIRAQAQSKGASTATVTKRPITIDLKSLTERAKNYASSTSGTPIATTPNADVKVESLVCEVKNIDPSTSSKQTPRLEKSNMGQGMKEEASLGSLPETQVKDETKEKSSSEPQALASTSSNIVNQGQRYMESLDALDKQEGDKRRPKATTPHEVSELKAEPVQDGILPVKKEESSAENDASTPVISAFEDLSIHDQAFAVPLPASSPLGPSTMKAENSPKDVNGFIAYKPQGPPPESVKQEEPLRWLPPNTVTPSPMKKGDLPVFSSTGPIPFGVPKTNRAAKQVKKEEGDTIWDVPETPRRY